MLTGTQIESIKIAPLRMGDVLVVKCPQALSSALRHQFADQISRLTPTGVKVVVLDGGMDVEVLRKGKADASTP